MDLCHSITKEERLRDLSAAVQYCDLCERLKDRVKVLSSANGSINSKVLFIAEAPGRLGADKTAIPLYGDKSGDNFESLLNNIGWKREDVFITNALLCNPRSEDGNNSTPRAEEVRNCSAYLEMTINLIKPDVIVTLGITALNALSEIKKHNYLLKDSVGEVINWNGVKVIPLYHTGPRAILHRSLAKQRADFIKLSKFVDPLNGIKVHKSIRNETNRIIAANAASDNVDLSYDKYQKMYECIYKIMERYREISFFKLTKLLYLIDLKYLEQYKETITGAIYLRQEEGPWCPDLNKIIKNMNQVVNVKSRYRKPYVYKIGSMQITNSLSNQENKFIEEMIDQLFTYDDNMIKQKAYLTRPMKYILKQEKAGRNMRKVPVIYGNRTSIDMDR